MHETLRHAIENGFGYAWFILLAIWGGTASYISRLRATGAMFSVVELVGEWTVSGFAGIVTAYFCASAGMDFYMTAAFSGVAGHMGGRGIFMLETRFKKMIEKFFGGV